MAAASTSATDSTATFRKHAGFLGLTQELIDGLVDGGIDSLGRLAFAATQPGQQATDGDVADLINNTNPGHALTLAETAIIKRLVFEAQMALIASIRTQTDPMADPSQRKLPAAERTARIENQRARLVGLTLEGSLEVGHQVYDTVAGMLEADSLRYLPPSKCITRMAEITATKPPRELKLDATGSSIVVKDTQLDKECPVNTELDVQEAMTRRALAFDAVGLIDFDVRFGDLGL